MRVLHWIIPIAATCSIAACGGSTGPASTNTTVAEAERFDALFGSACNPTHTLRCVFLGNFALPSAFGATDGPITLQIGSTTYNWRGFVYDVVDIDPQGQVVDSLMDIMIFSDTMVSSGILIAASPGNTEMYRLANTTNVETAYTNSGFDFGVATTGGQCTTPPALQYTTVPPLKGSLSCSIDQFSISISSTFTGSGLELQIAPQTLPGIRLVEPQGSNGYPN